MQKQTEQAGVESHFGVALDRLHVISASEPPVAQTSMGDFEEIYARCLLAWPRPC